MSALFPTMLFVPGGDRRKLAKIPELDAPALILALEDAVAETAKPSARRNVAATLAGGRARRPVWVRVNRSRAELMIDDVKAIVGPNLAGIVLPKVRSARDVHAIDALLVDLERRAGVTSRIELMPTIEDVAGLSAAAEIATASPRISCLAFGAGDFCLDVGLEWPPADGRTSPLVIAAKCQLVLISRRAGLQPPHDGSYPLFRDHEGLRREATESRSLGMFGKHAVHPQQVNVITGVFSPSVQEITRAKQLLEAFDRSEASGTANIDLDGQFVDYPVAARARQLLALAASLGIEHTDD